MLCPNGTLEFEVMINRTDQNNFVIHLHDDDFSQDVAAGTLHWTIANDIPYSGVNVSNPVQFSLLVVGAYVTVTFNTSRMNGSLALGNSTHFAYSAQRIIASGLGLPLSRLVVLSRTSNVCTICDSDCQDEYMSDMANECSYSIDNHCHENCVCISRVSDDDELFRNATWSQCKLLCKENEMGPLRFQITAVDIAETLLFAARGAVYSE